MLRKGELSSSRDEYLNGYPIYVVILKQYNIQSTVIGLSQLHLYIYSFTGMYITIIKIRGHEFESEWKKRGGREKM